MIVESLKGRQLEVIREFSQLCQQRAKNLENQSKTKGALPFQQSYGHSAYSGQGINGGELFDPT